MQHRVMRAQNQYRPLQNQYNPDPFPGAPAVITYQTITSVTQNTIDVRKYQTDFILNYKKQFGDNSLTVTGGFTTTYNRKFFPASGRFSRQPGADPIPNDKSFWYISTGFGNAAATSANSLLLARIRHNRRTQRYPDFCGHCTTIKTSII